MSHALLLGLLALAAMVMVARRPLSARGRVATPEERRSVVLAVEKLGWPAAEVDRVIARESGWQAGIMNPTTKAVGLIQFMPRTLEQLGFGTNLSPTNRAEAFASLGPIDQQPYIVAYFKSIRGKWAKPGDTYMALFAPAKLAASDATVLYPVGSKGWEQNAPLRTAGNGPITAGSVRARGRNA